MGNLGKLAAYLNELDVDLITIDTVIKTGNIMIDAVLNSKISLAKNRGITINAKAVVPKNLSVSEIDLSLIIGKLMENTMEVYMKTDENKRFIKIYIDILKRQLYIYAMNSTSGKLKKSGKLYLSSKNQKYHGFGFMRTEQGSRQILRISGKAG